MILAWAVLIAVCTPYAMGLDDALTDQGASKVVPGTSSARADELTKKAFPHRSEREVTVVVEAPDVRDGEVRSLFAQLDARLAKLRADGEVERTSSAYTLYRDATAAFLTGVRERARAAADDPAGQRAFVDREVAAERVPAALAAPPRG
ncbi:MMPL family transporter, partial [Streptomyces lasiicapitis]